MMKVPKRLQGVKKKAHARSPKQEKNLAEKLGGRTVKGSGSGFAKGDVRLKGTVLIEAKCTEKKSFSVTRQMLDKLEDAATGAGEAPVMVIEFLEPGNMPPRELVLMPRYALDLLLGKK